MGGWEGLFESPSRTCDFALTSESAFHISKYGIHQKEYLVEMKGKHLMELKQFVCKTSMLF